MVPVVGAVGGLEDAVDRVATATVEFRSGFEGAFCGADHLGVVTARRSGGLAHVPRSENVARRVPHAVSGRAAHPPKAEKDQSKKLNDKERQFAVRSAIAATADAELVAERGHAFDEDLDLPLVVSDEFEDLEKTQDALGVLEAVGVDADIERAEDGRSVRAGQGKARGRKYRQPKSVLVVTSETPSRAARNLAGVDVATAGEVNAEDLAPGAHPGRLTLWTESAIEGVADR